MRTIWFDMDGTIADLYAVDGWLDKLHAEDASPYVEAEVMWNMSQLARLLNQLKIMGYQLGIISWLARGSSYEYDRKVGAAKVWWLEKHLPSVSWDEIKIVRYGKPKSTCGKGILFDDEIENRIEWGENSFEPSEIFKVLRSL